MKCTQCGAEIDAGPPPATAHYLHCQHLGRQLYTIDAHPGLYSIDVNHVGDDAARVTAKLRGDRPRKMARLHKLEARLLAAMRATSQEETEKLRATIDAARAQSHCT